jgi:hypothetical protein
MKKKKKKKKKEKTWKKNEKSRKINEKNVCEKDNLEKIMRVAKKKKKMTVAA